jgi:N-acylneuraminate cytidylyltransferase/CMP-N,N'-diacetyllegionaminic acid synthase
MKESMSETIGLITARGGSKSIPRKNIKLLAGKPLIAWTIEAALQRKELSRVIVSTDDEEIAEVAKQWGAEVPFIRPSELARDDSSSISAVLHAIHWMEENELFCPDYVMLLQPTSPFTTAEDIHQSIELARKHRAVAVVSVCEAVHHPYDCKRVLGDKTLADFISTDIVYLRRQDLPPAYAFNGAIYLSQRMALLRDQTFSPEGTIAYVMPKERSLDVDSIWDWHLAELIMKDLYGYN